MLRELFFSLYGNVTLTEKEGTMTAWRFINSTLILDSHPQQHEATHVYYSTCVRGEKIIRDWKMTASYYYYGQGRWELLVWTAKSTTAIRSLVIQEGSKIITIIS